MVKIKGIEAELISAESYKELVKAVGNEIDNYEGFSPEVAFISDNRAIIYHDEVEEFEGHAGTGRYCCECGNYEWGKKCLCGNGYLELMHPACEKFSVTLTVNLGGAES